MKDIRKESLESLQDWFEDSGEKKFRALQVWKWLYQKSVKDFDEMSNLSKPIKERLKSHFSILPIRTANFQKSSDDTIKSAFKLHDDELIEGVLIPSKGRMTACVSSQVGCSLSCKFCATGYMKRKRNLDAGEIYDQVVAIQQQAGKYYQRPLTNIVFMGMGEPLLNYKNVMEGISRITADDGLGMSPKRITLSTAGIAKKIVNLAEDGVKFNLALSLHAANDMKRSQIMPINESNSLRSLKDALIYFYSKTKRPITFEYIIFQDFNDGTEDAHELYDFVKSIPSKVNIIEYNPISEINLSNTATNKMEYFKKFLENKKLTVNIRRSRGKDIDAACGQLANKKEESPSLFLTGFE